MKIDRNVLKKALEAVKPGIGSNQNIEQTTAFCFTGGSVITYNDEISISYPLKGFDVEGAVNAAPLYSFLNKIKAEELNFSFKDSEMIIKAGRSKVGLSMQAEIILPLEEIGEIENWKKLPDNFIKGITFAMGCTSRDNTKPIMTCVHVNGEIIEASDNFRIVNFNLDKKCPVGEFLLPANSCSSVVKLKPTHISKGDGWIHFKNKDEAVISCRMFEEQYPDTSSYMDVTGVELKFPKETKEIIGTAEIFSKREHTLDERILVSFTKNKLVLRTESEEGWFEEKTKTDYDGEDLQFSITPYLLKDILKETSTGAFSKNSIIFESEEWKYLTMLRA